MSSNKAATGCASGFRSHRIPAVGGLLLALFASACVSSAASAVDPAVLAASSPAAASSSAPHRIAANDLLDVTVSEAPELSRAFRVGEDGDITMPLVGAVPVAGLTPREAEAAVADRLRGRYIHQPYVSIRVAEIRSEPIYVLGEVNRPGAFPLASNQTMTTLQAVALGQGLGPVAARDRAQVIRTSASGERIQIPINLSDVLNGRAPDVVLHPNDVLFVPRNNAKAFGQGLLGALVRIVTFRGIF
jgi:polysaccharide biosynthesis/export protein